MQQLANDLWVHDDSRPLGGTKLFLRTTFVKLGSGKLWVHSPTTLSEELRREIDSLGEVGFLIAPSNGHNLYYEKWCAAFPSAKRYVTKGIPKKLPNLNEHTILEDTAPQAWAADLEQAVMHGVPFFDECLFFHKPTRSLIVTDLVQNHDLSAQHGFAKIVAKWVLGPIGFKGICIAPPLKWGFMHKDRTAFRAFLERVQKWDFERIVITHGDVIDTQAKETFATLMKRFDA